MTVHSIPHRYTSRRCATRTTRIGTRSLAYRRDGRGDALLPRPIGWRGEEIMLVESIVGEGRHVVHARGRLDRRGRPPLMDA